MAKGVIYLITNTINGKRYVGFTSSTVEKRWRIHVNESSRKKPIEDTQLLYRAIRKYGKDALLREVVAEFGSAQLCWKGT